MNYFKTNPIEQLTKSARAGKLSANTMVNGHPKVHTTTIIY